MNRRQNLRVATNIPVDVRAAEHFLFAYITNISEMGLFIRTDMPLEVGSRVHVSLMMGASDRAPLELEGAVAWVNPVRIGISQGSPGMGVRLEDVNASTRQRLVELVRTIAYVNEDSYFH